VSGFGDAWDDLAGKLTAAGVPATTDPRAVPPFVLVSVPDVPRAAGIGGWDASYPIWIVSTPPDDATQARWRLTQLETVYRTLGFAPAHRDTWGDRDCPAYVVAYPRTVPNPDC
jgi:hypothetical protein